MDEWTQGPGLVQSVWSNKWLIAMLVLVGILGGSLFSSTQPTRYEGVVRIFVTAEQGAAGDPERIVASHAQFIQSSAVSDRVIALTGDQLSRKDLEERLTVEASPDADLITIRALGTSPENAAGLADSVGVAYRQILSEQRRAAANQAIAELEGVQRRLASEHAEIQRQQQRTGEDPILQAEEQAKRREMEATANKIEEVSADMAGPTPALQDKAAVPDEPIQPKPLQAAAVGAAVGLAIGVALAWWLAAQRRARPREDSVQSQAHVDDDLEREADLVEHSHTHELPPHAASAVGGTGLAIQESPEQVRELADVHHPRALESVRQPVNSLGEDQDLLSSLAEWLESQHQNFPQITAERLRDRLLSDRVAVLLRTDEGLDLAGSVGWHPNGVSPIGRYDLSILRKLGGDGARLIGSEDRRELANAGLIGKEAQAIVVAPLEHENVPFGILLVGQEESASEALPQGNGVSNAIGSFARSVAPDLHAWLLLHRLREQLAPGGNAEEQTTTWPPYPPAASGASHGLGSAVPPDSQRAASADQQDEAQVRPD